MLLIRDVAKLAESDRCMDAFTQNMVRSTALGKLVVQLLRHLVDKIDEAFCLERDRVSSENWPKGSAEGKWQCVDISELLSIWIGL